MENRNKSGLAPEALARLHARIDPASIAHTAVGGEYWPVYLRPHLGSAEQAALGVVLKFTRPPIGLLWRLVYPAIVCAAYNPATLEQWRWQIEAIEEALTNGEEDSPSPNSVIYGPRLPFQGRSPERALEVLFDAVIGVAHGLHAAKNRGGNTDNQAQITSELLRSVSAQLGLAARVIEHLGRATIYRVNHHLVTTLDLAPDESCERHASDILTAAGRMASKRRHKETMVVCTVCTYSAEQMAAELIERLKMLDVSFIADAQPTELKKKMEQMLAGGNHSVKQ